MLREEGVPLREVAVLFRAAFHSQALEFELMKRDIPYEYRGGLKFFERAHKRKADREHDPLSVDDVRRNKRGGEPETVDTRE